MSRLTGEQLDLETAGTKCCTKCKEIKPLSEFSFEGRGRKFATGACLECERSRALWTKYGVTLKDYDSMFEKQGGKCKICGTVEVGCKGHGRFSVDHDHKTNKVRGLLCQSCNLLLGDAKDDIRILKSAIQYLMDAKA